jgi:NADPH-dependent ferric siderophore reductase
MRADCGTTEVVPFQNINDHLRKGRHYLRAAVESVSLPPKTLLTQAIKPEPARRQPPRPIDTVREATLERLVIDVVLEQMIFMTYS